MLCRHFSQIRGSGQGTIIVGQHRGLLKLWVFGLGAIRGYQLNFWCTQKQTHLHLQWKFGGLSKLRVRPRPSKLSRLLDQQEDTALRTRCFMFKTQKCAPPLPKKEEDGSYLRTAQRGVSVTRTLAIRLVVRDREVLQEWIWQGV